MIHSHLREYVIRPALESIGLYSAEREELLVLTAATESHMGEYLHQINGPAVGIFQMEPATHNDIWNNFLAYNDDLAGRVAALCPKRSAEQMAGNLYYAAAMAGIHYRRKPGALPSAAEPRAIAEYWKRHYNTHLGKGTVEKALTDYYRLVKA